MREKHSLKNDDLHFNQGGIKQNIKHSIDISK